MPLFACPILYPLITTMCTTLIKHPEIITEISLSSYDKKAIKDTDSIETSLEYREEKCERKIMPNN